MQETDNEIIHLVTELKEHIENMKRANNNEQKQLKSNIQGVNKKFRSKVNTLGAEIKNSTDVTQKTIYTRKYEQYVKDIKEYNKLIQNVLYPANTKKQVGVSQEEILMQEGGADGTGFTSTSGVINAGIRINDDTIESINRTERLTLNAEDTGNETLRIAQKQSETINQTTEELLKLESSISRAKKEVSWFARQLAGDRCFLLIFFLVVLAIAGLVFYLIYKSRHDKQMASQPTQSPTEGPPTPPPI